MTGPKPKPKRFTHAQRLTRRADIAKAVKAGKSLSATARRYRVSIATVRAACNEHGVRWESERG